MKIFYTIIGFTQSDLGAPDDFEGIIQKIPDTDKSEKPINFTGNDKVHSKGDSSNGSIVNGIRGPTLFSFVLNEPPGHQIYKVPRTKF